MGVNYCSEDGRQLQRDPYDNLKRNIGTSTLAMQCGDHCTFLGARSCWSGIGGSTCSTESLQELGDFLGRRAPFQEQLRFIETAKWQPNPK